MTTYYATALWLGNRTVNQFSVYEAAKAYLESLAGDERFIKGYIDCSLDFGNPYVDSDNRIRKGTGAVWLYWTGVYWTLGKDDAIAYSSNMIAQKWAEILSTPDVKL